MSLKPNTQAMIKVAKQTHAKYRKHAPSIYNEKNRKKFERDSKKTRKGLATRYRQVRNNPEEGHEAARRYMRFGGPGF